MKWRVPRTSARCLKLEPPFSPAIQRQHLSQSLIFDQHHDNRPPHVTPQPFSSPDGFPLGPRQMQRQNQRPNTRQTQGQKTRPKPTIKMWAHPSSIQMHTFISQIWVTSYGTVLLRNLDLASPSQSQSSRLTYGILYIDTWRR